MKKMIFTLCLLSMVSMVSAQSLTCCFKGTVLMRNGDIVNIPSFYGIDFKVQYDPALHEATLSKDRYSYFYVLTDWVSIIGSTSVFARYSDSHYTFTPDTVKFNCVTGDTYTVNFTVDTVISSATLPDLLRSKTTKNSPVKIFDISGRKISDVRSSSMFLVEENGIVRKNFNVGGRSRISQYSGRTGSR